MLVETSFWRTSRISTGPWQVAHSSPAARCSLWLKNTMSGTAIDGHPRDRLSRLGRRPDLLHFGAVGRDLFVADHALSGRDDLREITLVDARVAEDALELGLARVHPMAESHRLGLHGEGQRLPGRAIGVGLGNEGRPGAKERPGQDEARARDHFFSGAPGRAKATILPVNVLSYLFPPPAGMTTNCFPVVEPR